MLKAPSSEGLVPALVSSFFCLFPLHSHHVVGRELLWSLGSSAASVTASLFPSPMFPFCKGRGLGNKIHRSCLGVSVQIRWPAASL